VVALAAMPLWLRPHLVAPQHDTIPLTADNIQGLSFNEESGTMDVVGRDIEGTWTVANHTIRPDGTIFNGPLDPTICGPNGTMVKCHGWLGSLGLRQDVLYHPASHFWPLQWAETGVFAGLAALLAVFCFWWVRHRIV